MQLELPTSAPLDKRLATCREPLIQREPDRTEIVGHKGSIFYRAHSYHTKVPPEGIARLIEHYSDPRDVVLDPFCGSGMTGVACRMTGRLGVLSDLSPAACHIASGYADSLDSRDVEMAGLEALSALAGVEASLYGTACPRCEAPARVEYTVWSDVFACRECSAEITFWRAAVDPDNGAITKSVPCSCGRTWPKRALVWVRSDPVLESINCGRCRRVERTVESQRLAAIRLFDQRPIANWYPTTPFEPWREMWRGQHATQGIATAADFFTHRNLEALAALWEVVNGEHDADLRNALRFVFTAALNRASRRYQWNPKRPTNVLSSTMYIASLSYEFNVFSLVRRKLTAARDLYKVTKPMPGSALVVPAAAQNLAHIPDSSIHYAFTDPPFGSNIFYSDSSFLWEAWLNSTTDTRQETVVHQSQRPEHGGKSLQDYEKLMSEAFSEMARVLRPNAWASVMFHNSSDEVWSALDRAIESAGFEIGSAVAFDKSQASFKGLKGELAGERVPAFDLVLHLQRRAKARRRHPSSVASVRDRVVVRLQQHLAVAPSSRRSTPYLHSLVMRVLLEEDLPIDGFDYAAVENLCRDLFEWDGKGWADSQKTTAP